MKIQLIALLSLGARLVSSSQLAFAVAEGQEDQEGENIPIAVPAEQVAISVEAVQVPAPATDSESLKPLYTETPFLYEYPADIQTFRISKDREAILKEIPEIVKLFKQEPGTFNNLPRLAKFNDQMTQIYFETFVQSYPTLLDYPITIHDFWYLTILAITLSSMQIQSKRFFFDENSYNLMVLIIASLKGDGLTGDFYWPVYIADNVYESNSFYSIEVIVFLLKQANSHPKSEDFRVQVFRNCLKKTKHDYNFIQLYNIKSYENPRPVIMKLLNDLHLGNISEEFDIIKLFIEAAKSSKNSTFSKIKETFKSETFRTKFKDSRNVLNAFSRYFSKLVQPESLRTFNDFKDLFEFLQLIFSNSDAELRLLHCIFSKKSSPILANYEFVEIQYASPCAKDISEIPIPQTVVEPSAPPATLMNNSVSENCVIFDPMQFRFSRDAIYLTCLNPDMEPSRLVIPFLVLFCYPDYPGSMQWSSIVDALLDHQQINPFEMLLLALTIGSQNYNIKIIMSRVGDLFYPYDYTSDPQKWLNLRNLLKTARGATVEALLSSSVTKPPYLMFFPDELECYSKWIIPVNSFTAYWKFNTNTFNAFKMEVRIGNYPNSYQLVDSQDPIFSSVYPLSLAISLGNENAIKALLKYKSHLSKEHLEQAEIIASMGYHTDLFLRCKMETPEKMLYSEWINTGNYTTLYLQYHTRLLNDSKMEVRIGNYPNSYQLVNSQDPIFASVYPLSLAIILGNENAIKALLKFKSHLSKEHLEQAETIASLGFNTNLFLRCKMEIPEKIEEPAKPDAPERNCIIC